MDFGQIMGKAKELQDKMAKAKDNLVLLQVHTEMGAGMVKVSMNGKKVVTALEIDSTLLEPNSKEIIQDLCIAAINKALVEIEDKIALEMKKSTEGILPNIPGFDLSSFGK